MRKVVVFLVVLALGSALLVWLQSRTGENPQPTQVRTPSTSGPAQRPRGELTQVQDRSGDSVRTAISGPLDIYGKDTSDPQRSLKKYHLVARDSLTVGEGALDLRDIRLELFDPPTGMRQVAVEASYARARIESGAAGLELDGDYPITLRDTSVTYEVGSRFAPVKLSVPTLEAVLDLQRATSNDEVEVEGRGLRAKGTGLTVEARCERITIHKDPSAVVALEDGTTATLTSRGELVLRAREDLGPEMAEIEAREGAKLVLDGVRSLELQADVIRLIGRVERSATARFRPARGEAEGHVTLTPSEGTFTSSTAVLVFDDSGRAQHAALDGEPVLQLVLRGAQLENVPPELLREGETLTVALDGAGPLELFLEERERFRFTGPARLQLPAVGAALTCDGSIAGSPGEDGRFHELVADQNVRFGYEALALTTSWLSLRSFADVQGRPAVELDTRGATVIDGTLADGRPMRLVADGGLAIERTRDGFRVPAATAVKLAIEGQRWVKARADSLRDLDVATDSFVAEGQVEIENARGRGRGDRFEAWAPDRGEFAGTGETPAHFEFEGGTFDAQFVEVNQTLIHARGNTHAAVEYAGLAYDLRARWVVLQRKPVLEDRVEAADLSLDAGGGVHLVQTSSSTRVTLDSQSFRAEASEIVTPTGSRYEPNVAIALGEVSFELGDPDPRFTGRGHRLELRGDKIGRLEPREGEQVELHGRLIDRSERFDLTAERIDFAPDWLFAADPVIDFDGLELAFNRKAGLPEARKLRVVAGRMAIDRASVTFSEGVSLLGTTAERGPWSLDAKLIFLHSRPVPAGASDAEALASLQDLIAGGGVTVFVESLGRARAEILTLVADSRSMSMSGSMSGPTPGSEVGEPDVVLERGPTEWRSPRIDIDLDTGYLRSERGSVRSAAQGADGWMLRYEAIEPIPSDDETIQILRNPTWQSGDAEVRANWALLWLDAAEWRKLAQQSGRRDEGAARDPDAPRNRRLPPLLFGRFPIENAGRWMHELYLDGDVEYRIHGRRKARAESVYVDLVEGHGWIREFDLDVDLPLGSRTYKLKVQAGWLRSSLDGTLQARNAVATTCSHDVPHYVIKNKGFAVKPRYEKVTKRDKATGQMREVEELDGWDLEMEGNEIDFLGWLGLPLPRIAGPMNRDYEFDKEAVSVGNFRLPSFGSDSKFGTFISTSFTSEIGWLGRAFHWLLNRFTTPDIAFPEIEGSTTTHVDLHSRGLGVGTESEFESKGKYHWGVLFDAIYDTGEDHGLVRVDESERGEGRAWFRTRGRYLLGPGEWLDAVLTSQSDPGVQAEFFEGDYLRYEERESYLHWRRADERRYWSATLEARLEDFRTEVVDQPSFGIFQGRAEIGHIGALPIVEISNYSLERLARFETDEVSTETGQPYEPPFADGLGDRDVVRFDGTHRFETPWTPGVLGLRVTPYVEARATGWNDNAAEDDVAGRAALIAGLQTSTSLWKSFENGSRHVLSPSIAVHGDLASADDGLPIVFFDAVDSPIEGRFVDFALRSRWEHRELKSDLDVELVQSFAEDVAQGMPEGWLPLATRMTYLSMISGIPFGITHDGRYDTASGMTNYSRTFFGLEPIPGLDFETGYHSARDITLQSDRLYNALSLGARYALSPKWEVEGKETFSINDDNDRLASSVALRRFGHDFVLEIETSVVAGEGGASLRFHFTPLFSWHRDDPSMLDRWRALRR